MDRKTAVCTLKVISPVADTQTKLRLPPEELLIVYFSWRWSQRISYRNRQKTRKQNLKCFRLPT